MDDWHEAMLQEELDEGAVQCQVCPRSADHARQERRLPGARQPRRQAVRHHVRQGVQCRRRPHREEALYRFSQARRCSRWAASGCNFACRDCQNWQIAHADPAEATRDLRELPIRNLPVLAANNECQGVAWTYNEPTIWLEYILDGAQLAHEHGLYTAMVTNGYITRDALAMLAPHIDAYRVDVKGFSDAQYKELAASRNDAGARVGREGQERTRLPRRDRHQYHSDVQRRRGDAARHRRLDRRPAGSGHALARHPLHAASGVRAPAADADRHAGGGRQRSVTTPACSSSTWATCPATRARTPMCPNCKRLLVRRTGSAVEDVALRGTLCAICGRERERPHNSQEVTGGVDELHETGRSGGESIGCSTLWTIL